jgi:predicted transcriptional regulator YdeE
VLRLSAIVLSVVMLGGNSMSSQTQNRVSEASGSQLVEVPAFTVMGLFVRTTNAVEMSGNQGKIGPLWSEFMRGGAEAIPGVIEQGTVYAVYTHYESDETGAYDLILGRSVQPEQQVPENMKIVHIPAARYLVFSATDSSPDAIKAAWMNVYRYFADHTGQRRAFTFDFEQHSSVGTKIFIAVR